MIPGPAGYVLALQLTALVGAPTLALLVLLWWDDPGPPA